MLGSAYSSARSRRAEKPFDRKAAERQVLAALARRRELLQADEAEDNRQMLREILAGPVTLTPEGERIASKGKPWSEPCSLGR